MWKKLHDIFRMASRLILMVWESVLQILAPSECVICRHLLSGAQRFRDEHKNRSCPLPLCETCLTAMLPDDFSYCRVCGFPLSTQFHGGADTSQECAEENLCLACIQRQRTLSREKSTYPEGLISLDDEAEPSDRKIFFDSVTPLGIYTGVLIDTILQTKNRSGNAITVILSELLATLRQEEILSFCPDVICFVPAVSRTERERGTNNAELIARTLSRRLNIPLQPLLHKKKRTIPQKSLPTIRHRFQNVQSVYTLSSVYRRPNCLTWRQRFQNVIIRWFQTCRWTQYFPMAWQNRILRMSERSNRLTGKRILLVDDILTTGATCSAAARVLKEYGHASEVRVAVLARAGVSSST